MAETICVCGAGTMGSGIAQLAAQSGFATIVFDVSADTLTKSKALIEKNLQQLTSKGRTTRDEEKSSLNRLHFTQSLSECKADIIIEAIIENLEAKIELLNNFADINSTHTVFASNTSSLSINEIATHIQNPNRFAGLHFFNPAPVMKLVEIVKGEHTAEDVIQTLHSLAKQLGKTPVVCKDAPGFIVNRVARHYYLEAMKLLEQEVCSAESIDEVLEASGFKMGPFKLMDLIGLDVNYSVSNIVWNALGKPERLTPSPVQKAKVQAGELGQKTGKGFYNYS